MASSFSPFSSPLAADAGVGVVLSAWDWVAQPTIGPATNIPPINNANKVLRSIMKISFVVAALRPPGLGKTTQYVAGEYYRRMTDAAFSHESTLPPLSLGADAFSPIRLCVP
jgi:hypothetical protein